MHNYMYIIIYKFRIVVYKLQLQSTHVRLCVCVNDNLKIVGKSI